VVFSEIFWFFHSQEDTSRVSTLSAPFLSL